MARADVAVIRRLSPHQPQYLRCNVARAMGSRAHKPVEVTLLEIARALACLGVMKTHHWHGCALPQRSRHTMLQWSRLPLTTESVDARLVQELSTPPCLQAHECSTLPGPMMLRPYSCICDCFVSAYLLLGVRPPVYSQAWPEESLAPGVRSSSGHWCCQCVVSLRGTQRGDSSTRRRDTAM